MILWLILVLMALAAGAAVLAPILVPTLAPGPTAEGRRRLALAVAVAAVFAVALGVIYPRIGHPGLAAAPPPRPAPAAPTGEDAQLAALVPQLEAKMRAAPGDPRGWRLLGSACSRLGRYAEAADAWGRAAALEPTAADDRSAQGEALTQAAGGLVTPGARSLFARAVALDPGDARARYFLAMAKDQNGDHAGALADWRALIASAPPGAPWAADVRAFVDKVAADQSGASGPPGDAARLAMIRAMVDRQAAQLKAQPRDAEGWIRLMRSRMVLGDPAAASAALRDALAAFAGDPATQAKLRGAGAAMGVG